MSKPLSDSIDSILSKCTSCNACKVQCEFLKTYGNPREIIEKFDITSSPYLSIAFSCSLCGACDSVCGEKIQITNLFLKMRQKANSIGAVDFKPYRPLLTFETIGRSKVLKYHHIPNHSDTIFFPGCALPGTRPDLVLKIYTVLKKQIPNIGIVLDCCLKPSHDLGREAFFNKEIGKLFETFKENGVKKILVACPNCFNVFDQNSHGIKISSIYEFFANIWQAKASPLAEELTVHDPCPLRQHSHIHDSVRKLITQHGHSVVEMKHSRQKTICCGEGGAVNCVSPRFAKSWGVLRKKESNQKTVITYCSGCVGSLNALVPTRHIADLIFYPNKKISRKQARAPLTYFNRLILKLRLIFLKNR